MYKYVITDPIAAGDSLTRILIGNTLQTEIRGDYRYSTQDEGTAKIIWNIHSWSAKVEI